jgi:hypothetical protein
LGKHLCNAPFGLAQAVEVVSPVGLEFCVARYAFEFGDGIEQPGDERDEAREPAVLGRVPFVFVVVCLDVNGCDCTAAFNPSILDSSIPQFLKVM